MKRALLALAAVALAAPVAQAYPVPRGVVAATPDAALPAAACIWAGDIVAHKVDADGDSLYVLVNGKGVYRLRMHGQCLQGASRIDPIGIAVADGTTRACRPRELAVSVSKGLSPRPCTVDSIALLTKAQARALPKDLRP